MTRAQAGTPGSGGFRQRATRVALGVLLAVLALFHLWLLWQRIADQSVLEPWVAAKWVLSVLLVLGLWRLKRAGLGVISGRRAGVIWLLALLLHVQVPVVPMTASPAEMLLEPAGWLLALPAGVSMSAALAFALGLALAALAGCRAPRPAWRPRPSSLRLGAPLAGVVPSLSSRPPPHAS